MTLTWHELLTGPGLTELGNPNHDKRGRFAPKPGGGGAVEPGVASVTTVKVGSGPGDLRDVTVTRYKEPQIVDGITGVKSVAMTKAADGTELKAYEQVMPGEARRGVPGADIAVKHLADTYDFAGYPAGHDPPHIVVKSEEGMNRYTFAGGGHIFGTVDQGHPGEIVMNSDTIMGKHARPPGQRSMPSERADLGRFVIAHEYGHSVYDRNVLGNYGYPSTDSKALVYAGKARQLTRHPFVVDSMSFYGSGNDHEAFAEAFAEWHVSKGSTTNSAARTYAYTFNWPGASATSSAALSYHDTLIEFGSADQPRDKRGRWTKGGSGPAFEHPVLKKRREAAEAAAKAGNKRGPDWTGEDVEGHQVWTKNEVVHGGAPGYPNGTRLTTTRVHEIDMADGTVVRGYSTAQADSHAGPLAAAHVASIYEASGHPAGRPPSPVVMSPREMGGVSGNTETYGAVAPVRPMTMMLNSDAIMTSTPANQGVGTAEDKRLRAVLGMNNYMPAAEKAGLGQYTTTHEYGHTKAAWHRRTNDPVAANNYAWEQRNARTTSLAYSGTDGLSRYGQANEQEAFAEAFAEYTLTGGTTKNKSARLYAEMFPEDFKAGTPLISSASWHDLLTFHLPGKHNQLDHGRKRKHVSTPAARDAMIEALRPKEGGFTIDPRNGHTPTTGYAVAYQGHSSITPADDFFSSKEHANEIVDGWLQKNAAFFDRHPDAHVGGWHDPVNDEIVLDPSRVIGDRKTAIKLGKQQNQQAIADLAAIHKGDWNNAFIDTGGTGDRALAASVLLPYGSGDSEDAPRGRAPPQADLADDARGAEEVRGGDRGQDFRRQEGLTYHQLLVGSPLEVFHLPGKHDQSTHGHGTKRATTITVNSRDVSVQVYDAPRTVEGVDGDVISKAETSALDGHEVVAYGISDSEGKAPDIDSVARGAEFTAEAYDVAGHPAGQPPIVAVRTQRGMADISGESNLEAAPYGMVNPMTGGQTMNLGAHGLNPSEAEKKVITGENLDRHMAGVTPENFAQTVAAHEYGHTVNAYYYTGHGTPAGRNAYDAKVVGLYDRAPAAGYGGVTRANAMSDYGHSSPYEAYAEAYSDYAMHGGSPTNSTTRTYQKTFQWGDWGAQSAFTAAAQPPPSIFDLVTFHLPGKHNQKDHAGKTSGRPSADDLAAMYNAYPPRQMHAGHDAERSTPVFHELGYDGPPTVVSHDEFEAAAKASKTGVLYRHVETPEQAEAFRTGPLFVGEGYTGTGTYTLSGSQQDIDRYMPPARYKGQLRMTLAPDAKIKEVGHPGIPEGDPAIDRLGRMGMDPGASYAALGYDAIRIHSVPNDVVLIMNRKKVVVER